MKEVDTHLVWAQEMKDRYPRATDGMSVEEICLRWELYSDSLAAGWIDHEELDEFTVKSILEKYGELAQSVLKLDNSLKRLGGALDSYSSTLRKVGR
jgi:hypothetical protein